MVPVNWALASAEVNAGTASAARIAIIAITTSNSISVNADQNFFILIFIFGFLAAVVLRVFGLRGFGFRVVPPLHKAWAEQLFWGFGFRLLFDSFPGFWSENVVHIVVFTDEVNNYFLLFWGGTKNCTVFDKIRCNRGRTLTGAT